MGKLQQLVRTRETFFEKISGMSNASIKAKKFAINSFDKFSKEEFDVESTEKMIQDMKQEDDTVIYDVIQKWINWETITDVKNRFSHLNGYLYYHGIKISPQDVRYNLQFAKTKKREQYPIKLEEIQDILNPAPYFKKALYLALVSSGMRIGEALRIKKSDLDFSYSRIKITISSDIAKNGIARITWMSKEAEKYNIKKINSLEDNGLVWGSPNSNMWEGNVITQSIMFSRYTDNVQLGKRYPSGTRKITLHSLRAYFITKGNKVEFGFGHALGGHEYYMKSYDRYDEEDLFKMYLKLEPHLGIFDLTLKNQEITELQKKVDEIEELKEQRIEDKKENQKMVLDILKKQGIIEK